MKVSMFRIKSKVKANLLGKMVRFMKDNGKMGKLSYKNFYKLILIYKLFKKLIKENKMDME